ncbi:DUF262 domain-containing protein [Oceanicaulis sp. MMSF_3324]|uniref:DUF262 domain-containing protein n=1 Tax=Oceanicaulis sp. MMSF_3324 TaxID=3046702 RepID=UPI00273FB554|nr:DUF262 domain-containing protein [Oceanicaulis sp. MMSF_3324]
MQLSPFEPDIQSLVNRIDEGDIDLQPDFQRQEIWSRTKKKKLIDTVLRQWSIPPIHLVVTEDNRMEVLDGQQRLASLRDFVHNKFTISGKFTPIDQKILNLDRYTYKRLPSDIRRGFNNFTIRCFRITDFTPEEPSELFYRLNQPAILTAGEQRNALYGPAREQLKNLVEYFISAGNDRQALGFSNVRLAYDDVLARMLYFVESGSFSIKGTESRISERFRSREPFSGRVIDKVEHCINSFSLIKGSAKDVKLNKASLLSWLMLFSKEIMEVPDSFMADFYNIQKRSDRYVILSDCYDLFSDRASLRVTDVSSVILRDFSLKFALYLMYGLSGYQERSLYDAILDYRGHNKEADFEQIVLKFISIENWGRL